MKHVGDWITRLGSQNRVAERCGISSASLSQWMNGKYGADTTEMDKKIAAALGYQEDGWQVVTTIRNYRKIEFVFRSCKEQSMWMAISNKAGSGKTQTLEHLFNADLTGSVIFIQAEEWNSRQFLLELAERTCGAPRRGYTDIPTLLKMITEYLNGMAADKPVLIIDEADKLKPAAFRKLIPLYNRTEHRLGCALAGTENLHKEIARGAQQHEGVRRDRQPPGTVVHRTAGRDRAGRAGHLRGERPGARPRGSDLERGGKGETAREGTEQAGRDEGKEPFLLRGPAPLDAPCETRTDGEPIQPVLRHGKDTGHTAIFVEQQEQHGFRWRLVRPVGPPGDERLLDHLGGER